MRRGIAVGLGLVGGAVVGALVTFVAVLVYFIATGSGGPQGLGIAVVLAGLCGLCGAVVGAVMGAIIGALLGSRD